MAIEALSMWIAQERERAGGILRFPNTELARRSAGTDDPGPAGTSGASVDAPPPQPTSRCAELDLGGGR